MIDHDELWRDWPTPKSEDWGTDFDEVELFWPMSPTQANAEKDPKFWTAAKDFLCSIGRSDNNSQRRIRLITNHEKLGVAWKNFSEAANLEALPSGVLDELICAHRLNRAKLGSSWKTFTAAKNLDALPLKISRASLS